jgi:Ubiquitin family
VTIQDQTGSQTEVETNEYDFVWQLKDNIRRQQISPPGNLVLLKGDRELGDLEILKETEIDDGALLQLIWETEGKKSREIS